MYAPRGHSLSFRLSFCLPGFPPWIQGATRTSKEFRHPRFPSSGIPGPGLAPPDERTRKLKLFFQVGFFILPSTIFFPPFTACPPTAYVALFPHKILSSRGPETFSFSFRTTHVRLRHPPLLSLVVVSDAPFQRVVPAKISTPRSPLFLETPITIFDPLSRQPLDSGWPSLSSLHPSPVTELGVVGPLSPRPPGDRALLFFFPPNVPQSQAARRK